MTDGLARVLFDEAGNAIKVTQDGADFKYEFLGKLRNAAGTIVNPATQETLVAADTKLGTIDGVLDAIKDTDGIKKITDPLPAGTNNIGDVDVASSALPAGAATESTLAAADTKLGTIDGVLDGIKDTDGIKKITDQLPAGTNNIGDVDVASSALPTGAATEATLATRATEATVATLATESTALDIETELQDIKSTSGIKKITDGVQLQAGTNEIGKVAQGTKAAAADAWPQYIVDESGNIVSVILNNSIYRLEQRSSITAPDGVTDADVGALATANNRLSVASRLTDGVDWLATVVNNTIRRLETRSSVTSPDGSADVAVQSIDGVNHLSAGKVNTIDSDNSSVGQLGNGGTFVGPGTDVSQYASVAITVHSDEDSAADGMSFEFSQDNTNWDDAYRFNLIAASSQTRRFQFPVTAQYFRVNYTNGTATTTAFRVQTILNRENILTSIHRIEDIVKEDRSAQLVKSAIIAQREGAIVQDFYPVLADVSGNLKVTTVGSDIPSDPTAFILVFLENGGSENMRVDGDPTPVVFSAGPSDTGEVWSIREVLLTFAADDFEFDGTSFGSLVALTNGFSIEIIKDSVSTEIFRVTQNEDFLRVPGRTPLVNNTGPKDVLGAALSFQGLVLNEATSDTVQVSIRDDLTSTKLKYLTATLFAVKVT
jgi:hypothetical protein